MRRILSLLLAFALLLTGCAANNGNGGDQGNDPQATASMIEEEAASHALFPKSDSFAGDTMPFFEDGTMNVFYLVDQRMNQSGYHPWGLLTTKDYVTYEDKGIVIPYSEDPAAQDNALGTGCVMKDKNGLYHAFYTGHNDHYSPKEAIMHATSTDKVNWTKVPEDTFISNDNYSKDDFRDPYVFWVEEDQCYWMLVVTRTTFTGVIAKYTSTDLSHWTDEGIFFTDDTGYNTNMECPSVVEYKGKWYLAFSDQWPNRLVHIRVSDSLKGEFKKPEQEIIDGNGFYAGRLETDGEHLYVVGWNATKVAHDDYNDYDWGGNMVIHQVDQRADGSLKPVVNEKVKEVVSHAMPLDPVVMTRTIQKADNGYKTAGDQYELIQYPILDDSVRFEADVTYGADAVFGFGFAPTSEGVGCMNLLLDAKNDTISYINTEHIYDDDPQSSVSYKLSGKDSVHLTMLVHGGVLTVYVDEEIAMTARVYGTQYDNWQLVSLNSAVTWQNLKLYR